MANKSQKKRGTILGIIGGAVIGYQLAEKKEDRWKFALMGAVGGGLAGRGIASLLKEPCDTVNYTCYHKGKVVYIGICYADRKDIRMIEHELTGKIFTDVKFSDPKPRSVALATEKRMIQKFCPKYNVHHNMKAA